MNRRGALVGVLLLAGCLPLDPAPEDIALERLEEADALFAAGRFAEAEPHYAFVVSKRDRAREAYVKMALCQQRLGRDADAVTSLRRLLGVDGYHAGGLRMLAGLLAGRGQEAEALGLCRRLLELTPDDKDLRREIARLEQAAGRGK